MREKYVVNKLPNVVIPTELTVVSGRSQIIQPPEKPKVLAANAANGNAANGNAANNEGGKPNIFNDNPNRSPSRSRSPNPSPPLPPRFPANPSERKGPDLGQRLCQVEFQ